MSRQQLRASQLVMTFGPGAMVDLPDDSVIIGGLEGWNYSSIKSGPTPSFTINEPRLLVRIQKIFQIQDLTMRTPPAKGDTADRNYSPEVIVWKFPRWFTVKTKSVVLRGRYRRRRLVPASEVINDKFEEGGVKSPVVPVRFVRACKRGHVTDIDWKFYVHRESSECFRELHLEERGTSGDLANIFVTCECGAARSLFESSLREMHSLGLCNGARPWLGPGANENCGESFRLLVRNASNAYFPQILSAITIPPKGQALDEFVGANITTLKDIISAPAILKTLRKVQPFLDALREYTDTEVFESVERVLSKKDMSTIGIKDAEFEALSDSTEELGTDKPDDNFFARTLPATYWRRPGFETIRRIVLVHRLREVIALVGFTRFEAKGPNLIDGELDLDVKPASLARDLTIRKFIPAIENRGEGIFIEFDPTAIHSWLGKTEVMNRGRVLLTAFEKWAQERAMENAQFPGLSYMLIHTISHLLLTSLSLECGYPASSLRERIYALGSADGKSGNYGILIYTASSDAEGTLGGLVEAGRQITKHLERAMDCALLCSNDPVCAGHDPAHHGHSPLLGAACHGCLLISETSCEARNDYLDRALVVSTVEQNGCEFFS